MLVSPALRALSINARRVLDFLMIEHQNHAAANNGELKAPYDQLAQFGVSRRLIRLAIAELEGGGFLRRTHHGGLMGGARQPSLYRLTMYADLQRTEKATDEWRTAAKEDVKAAREDLRKEREARIARRAVGSRARGPKKSETGARR